ncbi:MAG: hypothetical protein ACQEQY_06875 [Halobacteriota archaeon]
MAAVPPSNDDGEDPEAIAFGIPAVDDRIRGADVDFPVSADELVEALDDPEIPYDPAGRSIRLSEAIERADQSRFESRRELLNALHPIFEEARERGGFRVWLRRLLPL